MITLIKVPQKGVGLILLKRFKEIHIYVNNNLLWRYVLSIPCPRVKKWNIVFKISSHVNVFQNFLELPRAMVEVQKAQLFYVSISQEYVWGVQICVHYIFWMQNFEQVDYLNCDFNRLEFGEKS